MNTLPTTPDAGVWLLGVLLVAFGAFIALAGLIEWADAHRALAGRLLRLPWLALLVTCWVLVWLAVVAGEHRPRPSMERAHPRAF